MRTAIFFLFVGICGKGSAQHDSLQVNYGIRFYSGQTVVHTPSVKNIAGAKPFGIEIEIAKQRTGFSSFNTSNAYVKTGWAFSYFNYDRSFLGHALIASRFIEPQYRISKGVQAGIRASIGIAYLSNPYDVQKNPRNNNYALYINPYLHLGTSINFRVSKHLTTGIQSSFHHISNGNIKQPNQGINWITAGVSMHYYPGNNELPKYKRTTNRTWATKKAIAELGIFYVPHQGYIGRWMAQRKYLLGLYTQLTKQVGGVSALTAGAEIYYNDFKMDPAAKKISSGIVAGIQAGHVFLLGKVHFSQQIGYSVYNKIYFLPGFYHRWALNYQLNKRYTIGASLKANSDNADFFDIRVGLEL